MAQQFVNEDTVLMVLNAMDKNGDGALSFEELVAPDILMLARKLSPEFERARKPGPPPDNREVRALASGYLSTVRADLAPGIADAPAVSVPISRKAMDGDVAEFLGHIK